MAPRRPLVLLLVLSLLAAPLPAPPAPRDADAASHAPVRGARGMVASVSPVASQVGAEVLRRGGNAVDAAVAVALALAVTWPAAGNLGGGGFMLVRMADGRAVAIDYREIAPAAAHARSYLDANGRPVPGASTTGPQASGVPGTVAGLAHALERYGTMRWAEVIAPAQRLADRGFVISPALALSLEGSAAVLARDSVSRRVLLRGGAAPRAGARLVQPELAATLGRLARGGAREFYHGATADRIVAASGGWITRADLAGYRVVERAPLRGRYRDAEILTMPPPSSGGAALLEALHILERYDLAASGFGSVRATHLVTEALRRAFADRAAHLGDPGFVRVPAGGLASRAYADRRAADLDTARASRSAAVTAGPPPGEPLETTHLSVVDGAGNVVANTFTLNDSYGNGRMVGGAGFLLNNEMDDFTVAPGVPNLYGLIQAESNAVGAGRRPASSMTPAIVLRGGRPWLALGGAGGPHIVSSVLQVLINVADFGMDLQQAVDAARVHHQWLPDSLRVEPHGRAPDVVQALIARGHAVRPYGFMGDVHAIQIDSTGTRLGASDPRRGGGAAAE